jgi:hypothetical protein
LPAERVDVGMHRLDLVGEQADARHQQTDVAGRGFGDAWGGRQRRLLQDGPHLVGIEAPDAVRLEDARDGLLVQPGALGWRRRLLHNSRIQASARSSASASICG